MLLKNEEGSDRPFDREKFGHKPPDSSVGTIQNRSTERLRPELVEGSRRSPKSKIQNSLPWWLVIPAGGGVAAIAVGSFWLGRRTKPQLTSASNALVHNTNNDATSPNGLIELPESGTSRELPVKSGKHSS